MLRSVLIQYSACFECVFILNDSITFVLILNVLKIKHNTNKMYPKAQNTQDTSDYKFVQLLILRFQKHVCAFWPGVCLFVLAGTFYFSDQ